VARFTEIPELPVENELAMGAYLLWANILSTSEKPIAPPEFATSSQERRSDQAAGAAFAGTAVVRAQCAVYPNLGRAARDQVSAQRTPLPLVMTQP